jgi:hypothetical protein
MIPVHPFGQSRIGLALDLNMDQEPFLNTIPTNDPEQFINVPSARLGVTDDFLQFFVQRDGAMLPVDPGVDDGKTKTQKRLEVQLECLFPGPVVINARFWRTPCHGQSGASFLARRSMRR